MIEMTATIIGIDCATKANSVGLAFGELTPGDLVLRRVLTGDHAEPSIHEMLGRWIHEGTPVLLALDAPLGWPVGMGIALAGHVAGRPLTIEPNRMFRRLTDRFVKETTGKTPLDVGADRIARTAHSALELLANIRKTTGHEIPLEWSPGSLSGVKAIEVYPAVALLTLGLKPTGYKKKDESGLAARREILDLLKQHIGLDRETERAVLANGDLMDAVLCIQAGQDFLSGKCVEPLQGAIPIVRQEGWIWFRQPNALGKDERGFS